MFEIDLSQANMLDFVLVDSSGTEVTGLGSGFTLQLSKAGGAFAASAGTKAEIGNGWYRYTTTADECNTPGPLAIKVTDLGVVQQNLLYMVQTFAAGAISFTYTLTRSDNGQPIEGAEVWISTDSVGNNVVWVGVTDALGVARDASGTLPYLDAGTYYFWRQKGGFTFTNPDTETVS